MKKEVIREKKGRVSKPDVSSPGMDIMAMGSDEAITESSPPGRRRSLIPTPKRSTRASGSITPLNDKDLKSAFTLDISSSSPERSPPKPTGRASTPRLMRSSIPIPIHEALGKTGTRTPRNPKKTAERPTLSPTKSPKRSAAKSPRDIILKLFNLPSKMERNETVKHEDVIFALQERICSLIEVEIVTNSGDIRKVFPTKLNEYLHKAEPRPKKATDLRPVASTPLMPVPKKPKGRKLSSTGKVQSLEMFENMSVKKVPRSPFTYRPKTLLQGSHLSPVKKKEVQPRPKQLSEVFESVESDSDV
jgi:hypothetical protein